ncbi:MAG: carboxypeptidase regulatory-like domain-containing protein [Gemmatimonadaceae bacterium]|nr:carboxypeptidase regulatory-like domain-containing protein [Gemmatimonadaceae bacterium]
MNVRRALLAAILLCLAAPLRSQVVRGRVNERATGAALAGVLVELTDSASADGLASALTDADGTYAMRAPRAGRFVVSAKRTGMRRYVSPALQIEASETVVHDLVLDRTAVMLPEVAVTMVRLCDVSPRSARVPALWEEARTALLAAQISLRDRRYSATVVRYVRELDPRTRRVRSETRSQAVGVVSRPFTAIDPESLSVNGYRAPRSDGGVIYHGLDAEVLLSDAFVRDHCFEEVSGRRDRRGLAGIGFRPVASRSLPDVAGTLWLDAATMELRFVEFAWSRMATGADSAGVGGEVHFARLDDGAWFVRRWFVRLPVVGRVGAPVATDATSAPWVLVRPGDLRLREEGGEVTGVKRSTGRPDA